MRLKRIFLTIVVLGLILMADLCWSWGFFAHKQINRLAVFTLPKEMFGFYKQHIDFITEHAVDPDKRRYISENEAGHHFIDLDRYNIDSLPPKKEQAIKKYGEDSLNAHGTIPWHIDLVVKMLTKAFKEEDSDKILRLSADLGHYVGDAHVPLHTTKNYNGQLSGQKGIHGFWESRLPELYHEEYDFFTGKASYISVPLDYAWRMVKESYALKDSVLLLEAALNKRYPTDRKYSYENRGNQMVKVYSEDYSNQYHRLLNGMVERRMRAAIYATGCLWFTAWVNAGQPDLEKQKNKTLSKEAEYQMQQENDQYNNGNLKGKGCD